MIKPPWVTHLQRAFYQSLPPSLVRQIMLLTTVCLVVSILGSGAYTAQKQTALLRETITQHMSSLAQNLAVVDAQFLLVGDLMSIEAISMQTIATPDVLSVQVLDEKGKILSEVIKQNGRVLPRFSADKLVIPSEAKSFTLQDPKQLLNGLGRVDTMSAWQPIIAGSTIGWVRVSYHIHSLKQAAFAIWVQALVIIVLAIGITLYLLSLLLRPPLRALQAATQFAADLDHMQGEKIQESTNIVEIAALNKALNLVSARLFSQSTHLKNKQFALDQHAIVSVSDLSGNISYVNDLLCKISGYSREELLGQSHRILNSGFHPIAFFTALWQDISNGKVWHGEIKNLSKNGEYYWVDSTIVPLSGPDGKPEQYIAIRTDITAIKNYELSLQEAKATAEAATLAKSQFLANMSHEIRTPMNAILGMLKLLQNTELSAQQMDYTSKTESAAQSLLGLLNDILDFSKMEAGKMELDPQPFRLDQLMRDLSVILSANIGPKPLEVLFDIDPATPKALIGDVLRLRQVLINLAGNAIKFTAEGEVVIQIKVLAQSDSTTTLQIAVKDSGIGIAPENQRTIFEGFAQAEASTTRRFGGTGLGLSICKRLVELMGGELKLDSQLEQGSTFYFTLTLASTNELLGDVGGAGSRANALKNLQVLVVDDNATAREIMLEMVQSWGWQADVAEGGAQAISLVETRIRTGKIGYQVMFVDWQMPEMDGWETCLRIREIIAHAPMSDAPIIIMVTTHGRDLLAQRSPKEQALLNSFLVKPITASMLFDAVADAKSGLSNLRAGIRNESVKPLRLEGIRLLVVEDNLLNQQVAQELLTAEGALVEVAANGQLGVNAIINAVQPFDAVLMDVQMPVMDGYMATHIIRHGLGMASLPVIAMTANAMASDRNACLAAGMNDHIGKPFDLLNLIQILHSHIRHSCLDNLFPKTLELPKEALVEQPEVASIDQQGALERLGGNKVLYERILAAFLGEITAMPDQLDALLQVNNQADAARLMHTLKGMAATVGANYLASMASIAEGELKLDESDFAKHDLSLRFRAAVQLTMRALGQDVPLASTALPKLDIPRLIADVQELHSLLNQSDMLAFDVHARLKKTHIETMNGELKGLNNAIATFDYAEGVLQCEALLKKYSVLLAS
ncbi:PAS domain-containing hybrid sensor histidine kinase/response regulator [Iodobacter sp.]|uniref:PAS domain-containing hybrid sensor histidine kinase/response regulator n=1 Tax=Iodobacter sp. TaxID=1915058 RepID=UPI0025D40B6F|nr:PAS domain-containing hybrid sensor histidine kinase/response regulator [Iodobacter sp.]